jgi:hypothetical protein
MLDWATPSWIEKPSLGIPLIKVAITSGGTYTIEERREEAVRERGEAEKEVLGRVPAEQRGWFETLMKAAQKAGYWSEDHNYYLDLYCNGIGRWITREIGRRFAEAGYPRGWGLREARCNRIRYGAEIYYQRRQ